MGGVLRITRAEFIKIFKKPSVYIMGIILAFTLVASLLFFEPENKSDVRVNITGSTISAMYERFNGDLGTETKNNYKKNITLSENKIQFYTSLNNRNNNIKNAIINFNNSYNEFASLITIKKSNLDIPEEPKPDITKEKLDAFNAKITALEKAINDFTDIENNSFIIEYKKQDTFTIISKRISELNKTISDHENDYVTMLRNIVSNKRIENLLATINNNDNFIINTLNNELDKLTKIQNEYYYYVINNTDGEEANRKTRWNNLKKQIDNIKTLITTLTSSEDALILIEETALKNINSSITNYENDLNFLVDTKDEMADYEKHSKLIIKINNKKYNNIIKSQLGSIINYTVSDKQLEAISKIKNIIVVRLNNLETKLTEFNNSNSANSDAAKKDEFNNMVSKYKELTTNFTRYTNINLNLNAIQNIDLTKINNYNNFIDFNLYKINEENAILNYLISNQVYSFSYNDVFSYNRNSSYTTTAWDFMFYAMKIASIIIVIFTIMMAANLVASEHDSGTIKLLAIRPYRRTKIITGKLFATLFFAIIFIIFSATIGLVAGICMYPLSTAPILAVFNATQVFSISPILLMFINLLSIIIEVAFFTIVAISLSTIFRSFAGAVSTSLITFILALGLNILLGGIIWYSFIPFVNIDFFRFLGGSFLSNGSNALSAVFSAPLLNISNFFISFGIYFGTLSILLFITYMVFRKRDF